CVSTVPKRGLEPPLPNGNQLLKLARLPVPPLRLIRITHSTIRVHRSPDCFFRFPPRFRRQPSPRNRLAQELPGSAFLVKPQEGKTMNRVFLGSAAAVILTIVAVSHSESGGQKQAPEPRIVAAGTAVWKLGRAQNNSTSVRVQLKDEIASKLGDDYIV